MTENSNYFTSAISKLNPLRPSSWALFILVEAILALIVILVLSQIQFSVGQDALNDLDRYNRRIERVNESVRLLVDAETGVRGYQLTGDESFLQAYFDAVRDLPPLLEKIEQTENPQFANKYAAHRVISLARQKMALLQQSRDHFREKGVMSAQLVRQNQAVMQALRLEADTLKKKVIVSSRQLIEQSTTLVYYSRWLSASLSILSLFLLVILFAVSQREHKLRGKVARMLEEEKENLESQVVQRTRQLNALATYLTNARESERFNLARELHDEMGSLLTAAKLDASMLQNKLPEAIRHAHLERLERLKKTLDSCIELKRRITNDLRPALLYDLGLIASLQIMADDFARTDEIQVITDFYPGELTLSDNASLALFRIVQESLTNIRKYARAKQVFIWLRFEAGKIHLGVKDDGVGFDPESPKLARHGLAGMQHRVQMLNGTLKIVSQTGSGTRIEVEVPLPA